MDRFFNITRFSLQGSLYLHGQITLCHTKCHYWEEFWKGQWWRQSLPSHSDWESMFAFAKQYLPRKVMQCSLNSSDRWTEVKKRHGPRSARGPDSMDRRDLQWLLPGLQDSLVNLLNHCERLAAWNNGRQRYYLVSLIRCRRDLMEPHLEGLVDHHQFGFLPGREAVQVWFTIQAYLEVSIISGNDKRGWVTDIQKAFENIPREPIRWLSKKLGIPRRIVNFWHNFLDNTVRYFVLNG